MKTTRQLQQEKAAALDAATAISNSVQAGTDLTSEQRAAFDGHLASAEAIEADLKRAQQLAVLQRSAPSGIEVGDNLAEKKPWQNKGEFFGAVIGSYQSGHKAMDPRLRAALGASESIPAEGGFPVAPEFVTDLLQRSYDVGEVAKRCRKLTMTSARMILNAVDESSRVDGSRWGGILAYWEAEGAPYTGTKPKFRQVQLVANKLIGLAYLTEELMEDTTAVGSYIEEIFPQEFGFQIDDKILNGAGAGVPLGVLNAKSAATVVQAKDSGQATGTVSTTNILNMWSRLWGPARKNAVWFINQSIEPQLYPLTLGSPSLGQILLYTMPGQNGNNNPYGLMFGRPVIPVEQTANLSSQGDIVLGDFSQYLLAQRNEIRADSSIHVAFLTGELALRFMVRIDGQSWWNKPLTPKATSAPTLSPFITLAAR